MVPLLSHTDSQTLAIARIVTTHGDIISSQPLPCRQPVWAFAFFQNQRKNPMVLRFPELTEPIRFMLSQGSLPHLFKDII